MCIIKLNDICLNSFEIQCKRSTLELLVPSWITINHNIDCRMCSTDTSTNNCNLQTSEAAWYKTSSSVMCICAHSVT